MAYDTTEAVAKFLSGFQMKITNRERDTVAPDYYVKYSLTLSKGGKDFSTTFVSDGEPTVTQVFSALADDALAKVNDFLKKSCMEFSVSLPGDEKDEDGYSLTGEAKDATASRDGLNGNQTRTLKETVTECKEAATALANGDAL